MSAHSRSTFAYWLGVLSDGREYTMIPRRRVPWFMPPAWLQKEGPFQHFATTRRPAASELKSGAGGLLSATNGNVRPYGFSTLEDWFDFDLRHQGVARALETASYRHSIKKGEIADRWNIIEVTTRKRAFEKELVDWRWWVLSCYEGLLSAYQAYSHLRRNGILLGHIDLGICYWVQFPRDSKPPSPLAHGFVLFPETGFVDPHTLRRWVYAAVQRAAETPDPGEESRIYDWRATFEGVLQRDEARRMMRLMRGEAQQARGYDILGEIAVTLYSRFSSLQLCLDAAVAAKLGPDDILAFHPHPLRPRFLSQFDHFVRQVARLAFQGDHLQIDAYRREMEQRILDELAYWVDVVWLEDLRTALAGYRRSLEEMLTPMLECVLGYFGAGEEPVLQRRAVRCLCEAASACNQQNWEEFRRTYLAAMLGLEVSFDEDLDDDRLDFLVKSPMHRLTLDHLSDSARERLSGTRYFASRGYRAPNLPVEDGDRVWIWLRLDARCNLLRPDKGEIRLEDLLAILPDESCCNPWEAYR